MILGFIPVLGWNIYWFITYGKEEYIKMYSWKELRWLAIWVWFYNIIGILCIPAHFIFNL